MEQRQFDHQEVPCDVAPDVPEMPFTLSAFRAHRARRGVVLTEDEAADRLTDLVSDGAVLKLGPNIEMWVGAADLDAAIDRLERLRIRASSDGAGPRRHRCAAHSRRRIA